MSNGPPANTTQKCASQKPTQMPTPTATTAKAIAILRLTRQAYRYPSRRVTIHSRRCSALATVAHTSVLSPDAVRHSRKAS